MSNECEGRGVPRLRAYCTTNAPYSCTAVPCMLYRPFVIVSPAAWSWSRPKAHARMRSWQRHVIYCTKLIQRSGGVRRRGSFQLAATKPAARLAHLGDTHSERERERHNQRKRERERERERESERERERGSQAGRQAGRQAGGRKGERICCAGRGRLRLSGVGMAES